MRAITDQRVRKYSCEWFRGPSLKKLLYIKAVKVTTTSLLQSTSKIQWNAVYHNVIPAMYTVPGPLSVASLDLILGIHCITHVGTGPNIVTLRFPLVVYKIVQHTRHTALTVHVEHDAQGNKRRLAYALHDGWFRPQVTLFCECIYMMVQIIFVVLVDVVRVVVVDLCSVIYVSTLRHIPFGG